MVHIDLSQPQPAEQVVAERGRSRTRERMLIIVYRTSVSLVVEPATHLVVTTRSTPRSVTAAAHSDDENRTLYDGS